MSHEDLAELLKKPQLSRSGELSYMLATPRVDRHARLVLPSGVETSVVLNDDCAAADLEMKELNQTSRFKNSALLEKCALANNMSQLQAVPGSFDDTLSATYATIDKAVLGIESNLMFVNVQDAKSTKDVSGSSYSLETAAAVMKDARIPRPSSVRTTSR
ncbi:uncharacterized protein J4E87_007057 [Alternaria ethzedia]|uniref:uncharacterized protein n=1 Tax=Alternaria ethzedia TaxID=181014 RepID=UPI0020C59D07|nr:uncharacterized protein J4E87_007057 [Alternaria ethzedia]KAI4620729.1 hypothetical protein J4E87_007057 [Alternaria ethzedia]